MSGHTPWAEIKREARYRRLRARRERLRSERGVICEERLYRGAHKGSPCIHLAIGYQAFNDIYLCGMHARGYLNVAELVAR
jgi:hypothetical protein